MKPMVCVMLGTLFVSMCQSCEDASPFITEEALNERLDRDRDGVKNNDDCEPDNKAVTTFSFWHDLDGDGRGAGEALKACVAPKGYVDNHDDCNDTNNGIYPSNDERCNDIDDNCDGVTDADAVDRPTFYRDGDEDTFGDPGVSVTVCDKPSGYVADHTDCNDADAFVAPDAVEICNSVDDDCDGATDTDAVNPPKWHPDADEDGYGSAEKSSGASADITIAACAQPKGYLSDASDCDDAKKNVHPKQSEVCNNIDDDCDGTTDEKSIDAPTFYADTDEDKYGNPNVSVTVCVKPSGYVDDNTDCDDTDKNVRPGQSEVCNSIDDNCDDTIDTDAIDQQTFFADADSDGYGDASVTTTACKKPDEYVTNNTDCDDTDKTVFPGQTEICNGMDDNCNGSTDTDVAALPKWYVDADEDGFGNIKFLIADCDKPDGYVANKNDCNDLNPGVHPEAAEVCNSVDDDCDGSTDANALDAIWYFADEDEDGYGNATVSLHVCEEPNGFVTDNTDCDDALDFIHPDTVEVCEDGLDNDCNGVTDTDAVEVVWYRDADEDGYGTPDETQMACSPPPGYIGNALDCDDGSSAVKPGIAEVCNNGVDDNCDGSVNGCKKWSEVNLDNADLTLYGEGDNAWAGFSVSNADDVNDDGDQDILIGSHGQGANTIPGGAAYLIYGPIQSGNNSLSTADVILLGENPGDQAGYSVASAGDVNNDGFSDVLVGAPGKNVNGAQAGAVYLLYGPIVDGQKVLSTADVILLGENPGDQAGYSVASAGDVNNDGFSDVLVGAIPESTSYRGKAYLLLGKIAKGQQNLATASSTFIGEKANDYACTSLSGGKDLNGDDFDDIVIGAKNETSGGEYAGAVYVIFGPPNVGANNLKTAAIKLTGLPGSSTGEAISIGDVNDDGFIDIIIGASQTDEPFANAGTTYILFGPIPTGTHALTQTYDVLIYGSSSGIRSGYSVSVIGDIDNNGTDDLLIGTYGAPSAAGKSAGAAYILKTGSGL